MTPKQTLLAHLAEHHAAARKRSQRRHPYDGWTERMTFKELQRAHARAHHRYPSALDHYHEYDNAGALAGPNTDVRNPSGWYTGEHVRQRR